MGRAHRCGCPHCVFAIFTIHVLVVQYDVAVEWLATLRHAKYLTILFSIAQSDSSDRHKPGEEEEKKIVPWSTILQSYYNTLALVAGGVANEFCYMYCRSPENHRSSCSNRATRSTKRRETVGGAGVCVYLESHLSAVVYV